MSRLEEIKKIYEEVNESLMAATPFNDRITRIETVRVLEVKLNGLINQFYGFRIICDESNNTSEVIDRNQMAVKLSWRKNKLDHTIHYIDLVFGDVEVEWDDEIDK